MLIINMAVSLSLLVYRNIHTFNGIITTCVRCRLALAVAEFIKWRSVCFKSKIGFVLETHGFKYGIGQICIEFVCSTIVQVSCP